MKEMLQLFRNKVYARFFLANILERLGSMIAGVSLMFFLLDQYGKQPVYATMTQIMMALPALIFFLVEESFMGRVQSLLSPLTTGFQLLSLGAIAMLFPKWIRADTLYIILFGLLFFVTCLYQAILPSGKKQVQGIAEEM
ncbi:hypothetical protein ACJTM1_10295 [Bacillus sp. GX]|uniref:hypothetical protein n=1 Tax=Bacillus TaxID=1386 RepID=UPI0012F75FCC|nr:MULTISPECIES: hypothetical protein [Bacillus]UPL46586.1 hypothetical protein MU858_11800 [Bacillus sp. PGP15]WPU77234.1 hypothetical protein SNE23_11765 [Bacillus sp. RA(2023)]